MPTKIRIQDERPSLSSLALDDGVGVGEGALVGDAVGDRVA